jgi:hypothetical protein
MESYYFVLFLFYFLISFVLAKNIGEKKQIGFGGTFLICLLLSPVIGGIISYLSKDKETADLQKKALVNQSEDLSSKIERLARLKEKGLLTDDEFQRAKSELLK